MAEGDNFYDVPWTRNLSLEVQISSFDVASDKKLR